MKRLMLFLLVFTIIKPLFALINANEAAKETTIAQIANYHGQLHNLMRDIDKEIRLVSTWGQTHGVVCVDRYDIRIVEIAIERLRQHRYRNVQVSTSRRNHTYLEFQWGK